MDIKKGEEPIARRLRSKSKHVDSDLVPMSNNEEELNGFAPHTYIGSLQNINVVEYVQKNPLENPLVISHVFTLLNLADLKHCRLVSSKWNDLAIPLVKKMSITIIGSPFPPAVPSRSLTSFNKVAENSKITYQSFKLNSSPGCTFWWSFPALEDFFEHQDVRELTIDSINILCPKTCIGAFLINRFLNDNLTHLAINNTRYSSSSFIVSTENLMALNSLSFKNCRLDIVENRLLAPQKLEMVDVAIFKEKWFVDSILVNEILTFQNLKELKLSSKAVHFSKLSINLASNITVDNLFLDDVIVQNFYESKWCITKKLTLRKIPFTNPTHMKFTELDFGGSTINLNSLSESIEKLTLDVTGDNMHIIPIQQPGSLRLGNLKYLKLVTDNHSWYRYCPEILIFESCLNLTTVKLQTKRWERNYHWLNTSWIPRNVRNIFLTGDIRAFGDILKLEQLVIQENHPTYSLTGTLDRLQSKHIILDFQEMNMTQLETLVLFINKGSHYESAAIRFLNGDMQDFKNSRLPQYVDKESHYYLFKNRKGRGIQEEEYAKLKWQQINKC